MSNVSVSSQKSSLSPGNLQQNSLSTQPNATLNCKQQQQTLKNNCSTFYYNLSDDVNYEDDDSFDDEADEEEEEIQWSFEQRTAALQDVKLKTEKFITSCTDLKNDVSIKVDALISDLSDAHNSQNETKYKMIQRKLQNLLSKKSNKTKQQSKTKR